MKTFHFIEKDDWGDGPWTTEPDGQDWLDCETFYACVLRRNLFGAWTGYVGVDTGHPLYEVSKDAQEFEFVDIHNGVKFTIFAPDLDSSFHPLQSRWWVGFECTGQEDLLPVQLKMAEMKMAVVLAGAVYRDLHFAQCVVELLAAQLAFFDPRF
jgi:hypothetical protein